MSDPTTTLEDRMRLRLRELEQGRDRFIADAQRNLAAYDAAINEIKTLVDPPPAIEQNGAGDEPPPAPAIAVPADSTVG